MEGPKPLKLDLGCGLSKKEGFLGVDRRKFDGVDIVHDLLVMVPVKLLPQVGTFAARAFRRPDEMIDEHLPRFHLFIPCVINHVFRFAIGSDDERVMARSEDFPGHGL